jgi:hypothetical protein
VILESHNRDLASVARSLGWELKPEGLCRGDVCVPLGDQSSIHVLAAALRRHLVEDLQHGLWALGPEAGRALATAKAPELVLPEWRGGDFALSSLLGQKVVIVAWAPW